MSKLKDERETILSEAIPHGIEAILKFLVPESIFMKYFGANLMFWNSVPQMLGYAIRKITNFPDALDSFITEFCKELGQQVEKVTDHYKLQGDGISNVFSLKEKDLINMKKILMAFLSVTAPMELINRFNQIIENMTSEGKEKFLNLLASLSTEEIKGFLMMDKNEQKAFLKNFFIDLSEVKKDDPKKDEKDHIFHEVVKKTKEVLSGMGKNLKDFDSKFAPGTKVDNFLTRFENSSKNFLRKNKL